jgi:hypothetical protein
MANHSAGNKSSAVVAICGILLLCVLMISANAGSMPADYDVIIYGGTSAGISAAIQTQRLGYKALLIVTGQHLGGLTSGGLGSTDTGNKEVIGGISKEFYQRVKRYYDNPLVWQINRAEYDRYRPQEDAMWTFEPHVAETILQQMLLEAGVTVLFNERLDLNHGVEKAGATIRSIRLQSGRLIKGRMFIDAAYEGDLLASAQVSYTVGREANRQYGETLNGVQTTQAKYHQFNCDVDPYVRPADPASGLLFGIDSSGPGEEGAADRRIQAYNFRLCLTDRRDNQVPFDKPLDYDETRYELLLRAFAAGDTRLPLHFSMMPNRKTDINNNYAVSTDFIGQNYEYPDGDYAVREQIRKAHDSYTRGLLWTLTNHPRVPQAIRSEMQKWGWARDEFADNGYLSPQMYIREARRMIGELVTTELHCRRLRETPEPVGMGSYTMDSHHVQRYVTTRGFVLNEGDVEVSPGGPYQISYRSIVPQKKECRNLLVPVCLSSSHIAYGSIRMEPVFMILGQSAATAAVHAIMEKCGVQDISYPKLRNRLLADRQVLEYVKKQ